MVAACLGFWAGGSGPREAPAPIVVEVRTEPRNERVRIEHDHEPARGGWVRPADLVEVRAGWLVLHHVQVVSTGRITGTDNIHLADTVSPEDVTLAVTAAEAEALRFAQVKHQPIELTLE